jgi:amylosucrase
MDPGRRRTFAFRLDRWWSDLIDPLTVLYGDAAAALTNTLMVAAATAYRDRAEDLHDLDERRLLQPDWFQQPSVIGYAAYADRFAGTLAGVGDHLDHLTELGVHYLHLMPLLRARDGDNDGGYAVADYRAVEPGLGTIDDLRMLAGRLRGAGISLVVDLVLNHVAREHRWAQAARAGDPKYRDYFRIYPDRKEPDAYEAYLPEVFPDFAPGNFTWDDEAQGWVWTTFNSWQWDVNWANADVFAEYAEIVLFLANLGVEVLRLDAIAFVWKRLGTDCQNQPEVHAITQALRTLVRIACPAVVFKAEAIVGPAQLVQYLGQRSHHGKVSDIAYHNSLMVQVWSMLATRDVALAARALGTLPPKPSSAAWVAYARCHDDIGWAISDEDAAAVGLSGPAHRNFLSDWYAGQFPGSPARGMVFQHNPHTGDRRISGTAAALAGLTSAGDDPAAVDRAVARILLAHLIVFGWGGIPVIWSGDELGELGDPQWADEPGHAGDNRWVHRPRLDWSVAEQRHDQSTVPGRVFSGLAHAARVRAGIPALHAAVESHVLPLHGSGVLPVIRRHPVGTHVGLYNVTNDWRPYPAHEALGPGAREVLHDAQLVPDPQGLLWVPPLAGWWIVHDPA